jgi:nicotinate-nucleotide adenylyltransferase
MLGIDAFLDMPNWYRPDDLITMIDFIVMTRPGYKPDALNCSPFILLTAPALTNCRQLTSGKTATCISITPHDISSTDIRQRVRNGQNISHLVPDSVASYISQKLLYRS